MVTSGYKKVWFVGCIFLIFYQASGFVPNAVIGTIDLPYFLINNYPVCLAISPDNTTVYVGSYNNSKILIIDIATNTFIGIVNDPDEYISGPRSIIFDPNSSYAYVTCFEHIDNGPSGNRGGVAVIDCTTNTVTQLVGNGNFPFNQPWGIAITPTNFGLYAYVTNQGGGNTGSGFVNVIDLNPENTNTYNTVISQVDDSENNYIINPAGIAITPSATDGLYYAFVCNNISGDPGGVIITLDTTDPYVSGSIPYYLGSEYFYFPNSVAIQPYPNANGNYYAYVTNPGTDLYNSDQVGTDIIACNISTELINPDFNNSLTGPNCIVIESTGTYAYVANLTGGINFQGSLSICNLATFQTVDIIETYMNNPYACALSPDGNYVYVTNIGNNTVNQVSINNNYLVSPVVGFTNSPSAIAITPDGNTIYVGDLVNGQLAGVGCINIVDLKNNSFRGVIPDQNNILSPVAIAMTQNGKTAYVANNSVVHAISNIAILDVTSNTLMDNLIESINSPSCLALSLDGLKLYVGNADNIAIIDTTTNAISTNIANIENTANTSSIAIRPGTGYAYAVVNNSTIQIINTQTDTIIGQVQDPQSFLTKPEYISISPDGTMAYVINVNNSVQNINNNLTYQIVSIDLVRNSVLGLITDSAGTFNIPSTIVFSLDGSVAYVCNSNGYIVSIIDTYLGQVSDTITDPSIQNPYGMVIAPDGNTGYIFNPVDNKVSIVSIAEPTEKVVIQAPATITVKTKLNIFLLYRDFVNLISWTVPALGPQPVAYQIYRDAELTDLIITVDASDPLLHVDRHLQANTCYSYYIVSVDSLGNISEPIMTNIIT